MDPRQQPNQPQEQPTQPQMAPPQPYQPPQDPNAFGVETPVTTPQTAQPGQPLQPQQQEMPRGKSRRKRIGLLLVIGPTALIIGSIILYAIVNFLTSSAGDGSTFGDQSGFQVFMNLFLFIASAIGILTWLPALIIGIVLLVTQKK